MKLREYKYFIKRKKGTVPLKIPAHHWALVTKVLRVSKRYKSGIVNHQFVATRFRRNPQFYIFLIRVPLFWFYHRCFGEKSNGHPDFLDIEDPGLSIPKSGFRKIFNSCVKNFNSCVKKSVYLTNWSLVKMVPVIICWDWPRGSSTNLPIAGIKEYDSYEMILSGSGSTHFRINFLGFYSFVDRLLYELL